MIHFAVTSVWSTVGPTMVPQSVALVRDYLPFPQSVSSVTGLPLWPPTRATIVAGVIVGALIVYAVLGGADFGGGVWDLLTSGPRRDAQRAAIARAIGPIWEANHVWLILAVVLMFTCFPAAFAQFGILLHIPLVIMLVGIVLRGSAFSFRAYGAVESGAQAGWGRVFAIASVVTPVFLGIVIGAVASGSIGRAPVPGSGAGYVVTYVAPWLTPLSLSVGILTLALFALLAAVYLTVDATNDVALQDDFRRRALIAEAVVCVCAGLTLGATHLSAPYLGDTLVTAPWARALHLTAIGAAAATVVALMRRRFRIARVVAAAQVVCIIAGWAFAQYPYLIPPTMTVEGAAAPPATLTATLIAVAVGGVILMPSLAYLFWVREKVEETEAVDTGR